MCGLTGFIEPGRADGARIATDMAAAMQHRGPDDAGCWSDPGQGIVLAHRRLAVLDITAAGHQPMVSSTGRYVVAFNGEIYNHAELRTQLPGVSWRGHSDTETLLTAIEAWGVAATLQCITGMFAFALWDRGGNELTLVRDRMGEKPLYYGWQGKAFVFASELGALRAHPEWRGEIDRAALGLYVRYGFVPAPFSITDGIRKLLPGHYLRIALPVRPGDCPSESTYWAARTALCSGADVVADVSTRVDALEDLVRQAVRHQLLSDMPLGAFLSGGIDSSTIVAMMQAESRTRVKTFSIGFCEADRNEAEHAKAVAAYLGTDHTELYVTAADALAVIPNLSSIYDEPFGDSSQVPTYLVSKLARRDVTVCLSGDGGDELFGGYPRYRRAQRIWQSISFLPLPARRLASCILESAGALPWRSGGGRLTRMGDGLAKLAGMVDVADPHELHSRMLTQHRQPGSIVLGLDAEPRTWSDEEVRAARPMSVLAQMAFHDLVGYLCDDILVKVDRAAMAVSLETRVPLLDHRVVEFALALPDDLKFRAGQTKWILRQVLYRYVPAELVERPKQGFSLPLAAWLRGPLHNWAAGLLEPSRIRDEGFFDPTAVQRRWQEHMSGRRDWQHWLWNVLMFQAWHERWYG
jgi:asparagine synthase (glutamine-hydrolysing)